MKKFLKIFFILPLFLLISFFGVACDDNSLKSISIVSISNISMGEENTVGYEDGYYKLEKGNVFEVNVTCNPSNYNIEDFSWESSDSYVILINGNVIRAMNEGEASINVSYKNSDGKVVTTVFYVKVLTKTPKITFNNCDINVEYKGDNILKADASGNNAFGLNLRADQDNGESELTYSYLYYSFNERDIVTSIRDVGRYRIICSIDGTTISTTKEINVVPKKICLQANNYTYLYGSGKTGSAGGWPDKLYIETPTDGFEQFKGVGDELTKNIGTYFEQVESGVTMTSNVGSYAINIGFSLNNEYANNYTVETVNGNLNIIAKTLILLPREQNVEYGQRASISGYDIYSYGTEEDGSWVGEANFDPKYSISTSSVVDYRNIISVGSTVYYGTKREDDKDVVDAETVVSLNAVNCLDVGKYFYKLNFYAMNNNIRIANNFANILNDNLIKRLIEVSKRKVTIRPRANQSKMYLENDPEAITYSLERGSFISGDIINRFLFVDYLNDELGDKNFKANVGKYYYYIKDVVTQKVESGENAGAEIEVVLNPNYEITLSDYASSTSTTIEEENKIKFEVKKLPIYVAFENVDSIYKIPNLGEDKQSVSYYTNCFYSGEFVQANYRSAISSLKIGNKSIIDNGNFIVTDSTNGSANIFGNIYIQRDKDFETNGQFDIWYRKTSNGVTAEGESPDAEIFNLRYDINLTGIITPFESFYESFYIIPSISSNIGEDNYSYSYKTSSVLNLSKVRIKIYPNENALNMTKVYDAEMTLPDDFGVNKTGLVSYTFDEIEDGLSFNDILYYKEGSVVNKFNIGLNSILKVEFNDLSDVGSYRIALSDNISVANEYAYFDIVIDDSKEYYFRITPREILIVPDDNQRKIYGSADPDELKFSIANLPAIISEESVAFEDILSTDGIKDSKFGKLTRLFGENVGNYQIGLGNLSFGDNYTLKLIETIKNFVITERSITITPVEYTTTYGDVYPQEIGYSVTLTAGQPEIDNSIYVEPTKNDFSGAFVLGVYNTETEQYDIATKIGNFYPAGNYIILQGTFSCSDNYQIDFSIGKKFIVERRQTIINFVPQAKSISEINQFIENVPKSYYETPTNLADSPSYDLLKLTLASKTGMYYLDENVLDDATKFQFKIMKNGYDITESYELIFGKKIVYTVNVQVIDLVLLNVENRISNIRTCTYNGQVQNDNFILVSQTVGYDVSFDEGNCTSYNVKYRLNGEDVENPKNAGYYNSYIELGTSDKIVIKKSIAGGYEYLNFSSIDDESSNYVLNLVNVAYLNITKADIDIEENLVSFDGAMQYGTGNIPRLKKQKDGEEIFKGVSKGDGTFEKITLKEEGGLNYTLSQTNPDLKAINVSERNPIVVTIENTASNNYNSRTFTAYLKVVPREVVYHQADFEIGYTDSNGKIVSPEKLSYSGKNVQTRFSLSRRGEGTSLEEIKGYQVVYDFKRVTFRYENQSYAEAFCYKYVPEQNLITEFKVEDGSPYKALKDGSDNLGINSGEIIQLPIKEGSYVIYNNAFAIPFSNNQEEVPIYAGIYICFATCVIDSNYAFTYGVGVDEGGVDWYPNGNSITFATVFEIERSSNIKIEEWQDKFKYTTVFDFDHPETLPFSYKVTPSSLKQEIEYVLNDKLNNRPLDNVLSFGNYKIILKVDEQNYFFTEEKGFSITKLDATIVYPSVSSYVYTGNVINSYLSSLGAVLRDKDNNAIGTVYYNNDMNSFDIKKYKIVDREEIELKKTTEDEPVSADNEIINIGSYKVVITYGSENGDEEGVNKNYYGKGEYYFSVVPAPYTGTVTFKDSRLTYNPSFNMSSLYNSIISNRNVFNIDMTTGQYTLKMYRVVNDQNEETIFDGENFGSDESFKSFFKVGLLKIRLRITFENAIIDDYQTEAWLSIMPMTITDNNFLKYTTNSTIFTYTGYRFYQDLTLLDGATPVVEGETWEGRLIPVKKENIFGGASISQEENWEKQIRYNGQLYTVLFSTSDYTYVVRDRLGNKIFSLKYFYSPAGQTENNSTVAPISPGEYKIHYTFTLGDEYGTSSFPTTFNDRLFRINKVDILYVIIESKIDYEFDGKNLASSSQFVDLSDKDAFGKVLNQYYMTVKNDNNVSQTNMNYKFVTSDGAMYEETDGVCLFIQFYEVGQTNPTNSVINVGKYKISIKMMKSSSYDLSKYFNKIETYVIDESAVLSRDTYTVYAGNGTEEEDSYAYKVDNVTSYHTVCEGWLHIAIKVNTENYSQAIEFSTAPDEIGSGEDAYLQIKFGTTVSIVKPGFTVELQSSDKVTIKVVNPSDTDIFKTPGTYYLRFTGDKCLDTSFVKIVVLEEEGGE